jgi:alanyl aminopeptidase
MGSAAAGALLATLVFAAGIAGAGAQGEDPLRLAGDVVPVRQQVTLKLDADQTAYTGSTTMELKVLKQTGSFRLHAEEMTLESVVLTGPSGPVAVTHEKGPIGLTTFAAAAPLAPGAYTLSITFANEFGTRATGLYRVQAGGLSYLFTQFEAEDAREAFPCFDEPDYKIPFRVTLSVPDKHVAVTNTPVESETKEAGWRTIRFRETKPLPTYLIAIATGPMDVVPIPGMRVPGNVVTPRGQGHLAARAVAYTPKILAAMERWFGSPYPFEKLDLIAIPEYWPGAMENPGAITFRDLLLLFDDAAASTAQKRTLARITAHELAHMWFGDVVTMKWWDDLWLNESFADWAGDKITDQVFPEFQVALTEMEDTQEIMQTDARPSTQPIRRPVKADTHKFEQLGVAYNKGKAVLSMFERWVGEEKFRQGVLAYIKANAWDNATADDLWRSLSEVSGVELSPAMETFLVQNGVPSIQVEPLDQGRVRLTQTRFLNHGVTAEPREWRIPVTLRYPGGGDMPQTTTVLLKSPSEVIQLPGGRTPEWIFPDADGAGYYRWSVPEPMLGNLAENAGEVLNARERIAFLGNLASLLEAGTVGGDEYLRTLQQFAADPEPQVISYLASLLEKVKLAFVPEEAEDEFAVYVRRTLGPALERFGMAPKAGEPEAVALLRPRLLAWMGDDGRDARVLDYAERVTNEYMKNPASVDPALAGAALRLAAIRGDRKLFDAYRQHADAPRTPDDRGRYLSACGYFRKPELMKEALGMVTSGTIRGNEMFGIITGLGETPSGRALRYAYVVQNYDAIVGRLPAEMKTFMPMFAAGCEADRLEEARAFFADPSRKDPATDRSVTRVADQVSDCVNLRTREGKSVAGYLDSLSGGM